MSENKLYKDPDKKFCIYRIYNKINGKSYFGKTKANTTKRWKDHITLALTEDKEEKKYPVHHAIYKYGLDNFEFSIQEYFYTSKDALEAEPLYIKKYDSLITQNGYNVQLGGASTSSVLRKFSQKEIIDILTEYTNTDSSTYDLAEKYNYSKSTLLAIFNKEIYLDVDISDELMYQVWLKQHRKHAPTFVENSKTNKLKNKLIPIIFKKFNKGIAPEQIAKEFGVVKSNIFHVLERNTWTHVDISENILNKTNEMLLTYTDNAFKNKKSNINFDLPEKILKEFIHTNISPKELEIKYNLMPATINAYIKRLIYKNKILLTNKEIDVYEQKHINLFINKINKYPDFFIVNLMFEYYVYKNKTLTELKNIFKLPMDDVIYIIDRKMFSNYQIDNDLLTSAKCRRKMNRTYKEATSWTTEHIINVLNLYLQDMKVEEIEKITNHDFAYDIIRLRFNNNFHKIDEFLIAAVKNKRENSNKKNRMTPEIKEKICLDFLKNFTFAELSAKYSFSIANLYSMVEGRTHKKYMINEKVWEDTRAKFNTCFKASRGKPRIKRNENLAA